MLPEFSRLPHNSADPRISGCAELDAENRKPGARTAYLRPECKDMYSLRPATDFFFFPRYLLLWFGFDADELTCANLALKGDQFHD